MRSVDAATPPQVLISATFTASPLEEPLAFWLRELRLPHQAGLVGYQQLFQTLLDPVGPFAANQRGANVALFRLEDLTGQDSFAELEANALDLTNTLISSAEKLNVPLLVCLCPDSAGFLETEERQQFASSLRTRITEQLKNRANLYVLCPNQLIADYEVTEVDDPLAQRAGHVPYRSEFYIALGTGIVRTIAALERRPLKVIAVDCDNTLWTGVCGEDGPAGVQIDAGRRALQTRLLQLKQAGWLIALVSKNNEGDVRETFQAHQDMPLQWSDVAAHRINWNAKSSNLLQIAEELNLGLDSFVFLEDDGREAAEVRENRPEVVTIQVPSSSGDLPHFLKHLWVFDHVKPITEEDQKRTQRYAEQTERKRFEQQAGNLRDFLAGLRLETLFGPVTAETLPRVAQLTQRTNQMNTMLRRYSEAELAQELANGMHAFTVTVSDRFGSYGLVGVLFAHAEAQEVRVTDFMLSCRALGRGVEHQMLAHAGELAESLGKQTVGVGVIKGPRNQPAVEFLKQTLKSDLAVEDKEAVWIHWPTSKLKTVELQVSDEPVGPAIAPAEPKRSGSSEVVDYSRIAGSLSSAAKIEVEIQQLRRKKANQSRKIGALPETELEHRLAAIWRDLLGLETVGIDEDFFDLGGHSLLAVQLLSRIHRELGIDLPDSVIYHEKLRISNLARTIELLELGIEDRQGYEAALAEIESLSDEEVEALLAQEMAGEESNPNR
jgi:FkbH-like protein